MNQKIERKFKVALAQYPISFHQSLEEWKKHTADWVERATRENSDVLIFPEYGSMELVSLMEDTSRQDLNKQLKRLKEFQHEFIITFSALAIKHQCYILAPSFPFTNDLGKITNRAYWFNPTGTFVYQEKIKMTRFENEEWKIRSGDPKLKIIRTPWCKIGICICYDVEFPQLAAKLCQNGAEVILVPSCTETSAGMNRVHIGAKARALENQCYVLVSQTVGEAEWSIATDKNSGLAAVYGPPDLGFPRDGVITHGNPNIPSWLFCEIDLSKVENVREKGQVFNFKDSMTIPSFEIEVTT